MASYLELCQQLQRELGVAGTPMATITGQTGLYSKLVNWIADADVFIQSLHWDWNFLWSQHQTNTVAANQVPTSPTDLGLWDEDSFYLDYSTANHKKLRAMDYFQWRTTLRQGVKTQRKPSIIVVKPDKTLIFDVPPDDVYSLTGDYWKTPTKMTANDDVSEIPVQFHRIIVVQAKLWFAEEEEIPTVYQSASSELRTLLMELESHELPQQARRLMGAGESITVVPE
jgi:hypothetical protein